MINAKVIAHSRIEGHPDLVTLQLTYPRYIHAEFMTHRVFSRNASSSRAIPVKTMLRNIKDKPAVPLYWGCNKPGMQAGDELKGWKLFFAKMTWNAAARSAVFLSGVLHRLGLHKQHANRITEPFQFITTLVTATEWDNFFILRDHPDAQPEIKALAQAMKVAIINSEPRMLKQGQWHMPYINPSEFGVKSFKDLQKASAARCARVSYLTHDGNTPTLDNDLKLFERLAGSEPIHASPLEHVATPTYKGNTNFVGWKQFRKVIEE